MGHLSCRRGEKEEVESVTAGWQCALGEKIGSIRVGDKRKRSFEGREVEKRRGYEGFQEREDLHEYYWWFQETLSVSFSRWEKLMLGHWSLQGGAESTSSHEQNELVPLGKRG
jgi:hypothetical protein